MKKILTFIIISILLFSLLGCNNREGDNTQAGDYIVKVPTLTVQQDTIRKTITLSGRLEGARDIMILPQMSGRIDEILVEVGERVEKGQTLVKMDREKLEQAESKYKAAKKNYKRLKRLWKDSLVSPKNYEKAKSGYKTAKAAYKAAKKNIELTAPFSGTVVKKYFKEDQIYAPNRRGIIRLATTENLQMEVNFASKDYQRLENGQEAIIHTKFSEKPVRGSLTDLTSAADAATGLFSGEIVINNPRTDLTIGVFAEAKVILEEHTHNVVIPHTALVRDSVVYVVKGNTIQRRVVETGIMKNKFVEINKGLEAGEKIVKEGTVGLKDGMKVMITSKEK